MLAVREEDVDEEDEGLWPFDADSDTEVSDWRVCNAAIWLGSESKFASMAESGGGVWGSGSSIGDDASEGEPWSRVSHIWRSIWRL